MSDIAITGLNPNIERQPSTNGVEFSNPSDSSLDNVAGRWVLERVHISNCTYGVYKPFGNIGNHFIDCTFKNNDIGVLAEAEPDIMHNGCDRYSGGHFDAHTTACLYYQSETSQVIIDGTIFEYNHTAWAISIHQQGRARMTWNAIICLRNVWFEANDNLAPGGRRYSGY